MKPHADRALPAADAAHRDAQEALPWLANGSLAGAELERVQAHLQACALCRADLALLVTLRGAGPGPAPDCDLEGALARLLPQLDAAAPPAVPTTVPTAAPAGSQPAVAGWRARFAANDRHWLRVAAGLQCGVIVALAALLARPSAAPDPHAGAYRVLGASPAPPATLVVTFRPDTPERELRRIVRASGGRIVGGPTATGAWLLDTEGAAADTVARLHAEPAVTLAESLGTERRP